MKPDPTAPGRSRSQAAGHTARGKHLSADRGTDKHAARALGRMRRTAEVLAVTVLVVALAVLLLGWGLGIEGLRRIGPGLPAMVPSTAVCLALLAAGFLAHLRPGAGARYAVAAIALAVTGFAAWRAFQVFAGPDVQAGADRMSAATAIGLALAGSTLLARAAAGADRRWIATWIATAGLFMSLFTLDSILSDPGAFWFLSAYSGLALHTGLALGALFLAVLLVGPPRSWLPTILGPGRSAVQARRLLPFAIAGPTLLGFVAARMVEFDYLHDTVLLSSLTMTVVAAGTFVVARNARIQDDADTRAAIDEARLEQVLDGLDTAVFVFGEGRALRMMNRRGAQICGGDERARDWLFKSRFHSLQDRRPLAPEQNPVARLLSDDTLGDQYAGYVDHEMVERALRFSAAQRVEAASGLDLKILSVVDETDSWKMRAFLAQQERLDLVAQMSGGIAHDIANILGAIRLAADTGGLHGNPEKMKRSLATIQKACDRGAWLTERLARMTRATDASVATIDAAAAVGDALLLACRSIPAFIGLEQHLPQDPCPVKCEPADLESAVLNLVINARAALIDADRTSGQIVVSVREAGSDIVLEVSDDGPGMPAHVLERATEAFFTTRPGEGTGLGLAMIATFAARVGGDFTVRSAEGVGTTAILSLPRAPEGADAAPASGSGVAGIPDLGGLRILVVEDDPQFHDLLIEALAYAGADVSEASGFDQGMAILSGPAPLDLLLTDVILPGPRNGLDLADAAERLRPDLPVIYLSGYSGGKSIDVLERQGIFLRKPVNLEILANTIRLLLPERLPAGTR